MNNTNTNENGKIMHKDLSYKLQGLFFAIRNDLGSGHKESIYQKALENELKSTGINFKREPAIKIYSLKGDFLGLYRPDFLIEDKIIVELKAVDFVTRQENARVYDYLRNSEHELAYLVNFASTKLYVRRFIFTNDRKNNSQVATNMKRVATSLILFVAISSVLFVGIRGLRAEAARVFFEPASNTHEVGDSFTVSVKLDTQGENINAIDLGILYPPLLEIKSISKSGSAVQLWVQEPNFTSTGVFISGGSPGGIKSSNALIAKITMRAKAIGGGSFQLTPTSSVLLNDGEGTKASLAVGQMSFNITAQSKKDKPDESVKPSDDSMISPEVIPETEKQKEEPKDKTKPKNFKIFLGQDPRVFGGKYFISFFTTDSKSGIDHYEVKDGDGEYKIAQSPYLLSDQKLGSVIRVKAYDGAGNYREVVYQGLLKRLWLWIIHLL